SMNRAGYAVCAQIIRSRGLLRASGWWDCLAPRSLGGRVAGCVVAGWRRGPGHWQAGCGPGGESAVQVGGVDEAKLLQGRCGQAGLVSLVADEDDAQVPAGDGGVPPLGRGVAAPFQGVAGHYDGAGDQAVLAPLVVVADVDEQSAAGLGVECLGR